MISTCSVQCELSVNRVTWVTNEKPGRGCQDWRLLLESSELHARVYITNSVCTSTIWGSWALLYNTHFTLSYRQLQWQHLSGIYCGLMIDLVIEIMWIKKKENMKSEGRKPSRRKHSVHWFRKGLRLSDNPALLRGIRRCETFRCIFILDPWFAGSSNVGTNKWR